MDKWFLTREPRLHMGGGGGKDSLQQIVLGKLNSHSQKNEVEPLPYIICKINKKCVKDLNVNLTL